MSKFPKHMIEAIQSKECILFIGSGISVWSGLPNWERLIRQMVEFLCDSGLKSKETSEIEQILLKGDLLTGASLCTSLMRKGNFRDFIEDVFIKPNPKPHEIHKIIANLGPDSFITTNYDRLIDDAYQIVHDGLVLSPINNDQPIEQARIVKHGASRFIFSPHGRAEKSDTIILTREDYRDLKYKSKFTISTLQHLLISRPVIYLGFGLQDPDFLMIKDEIAAIYQGGERDHFAIMPDISDLQKNFWKDHYGINIISYETKEFEDIRNDGQKRNYKSHDGLLTLLRDLNKICNEDSSIKHEIFAPKKPFAIQIRSSLMRYCEDIIHNFSAYQSNGLALTVSFRKDLSPGTGHSNNYGKQQSLLRPRSSPVLELFNTLGNLILIGSPGAGKSYSVMTYAAILAESTLNMLRCNSEPTNSDIRHLMPLILPMREYTGDVKEMISARLPRSVDVDKALECGCLVLIFDAVNEASRDLVDTKVLANNISWLISRFPKNKFIFTSRSVDYASFLSLPVFELEPLSFNILSRDLEDNCGISLDNLSDNIKRMLTNPLFLDLFIQAKKEDIDQISNAVSLLREYFSAIEQKLIQETELMDLSLMKLLTPVAYQIIDNGSQTTPPEQILSHFNKTFNDYSQQNSNTANDVFHALISLGVFVPDAEGKIGFFHQTVLEYLAAFELSSLYKKDKLLLEEKINFLRWDETIILFISLLSPKQSEVVLRRIAEIDIVFACRAFESAAIQEDTMGHQLFDIISQKLSKSSLSFPEKKNIAQAIRHIGSYGNKDVLLKLLDDNVMANASAIALARMKVKDAVPKIIELLLKDNMWPSDFAKALGLLVDESIIPQLIEYGKQAEEDSLTDSNLAEILSKFESEYLYSELSKLAQSEVSTEKQFAAEVLKEMNSDRAMECLAQMLYDSDHGVLWRAILGLRYGQKTPYKSATITAQMFDLLSNEESGDSAASYLEDIADEVMIKEAVNRLQNPRNEYVRINLCAIIAKSDPKTSKKILFAALDNYNPSLNEPLRHALASLDIKYLIPDIFDYFKKDDAKLRLTVLEALRWALGHEEQLSIDKENCECLITIWETTDEDMGKHIAGTLLTDHCPSLSKDMLLKRLSDVTYPFRDRLIEFVARLPLVKGDLPIDVIEWLITKLHDKSESYPMDLWNPAARILGRVCDEGVIKVKLIPLLNSNNEVLRGNAYIAVSEAERVLGKRFIKK